MTTTTLQQETSWLQTDGWQHIPGLVHGFSNRLYDRESALEKLKANNLPLHTLKQVHGNRIVVITHLSPPVESLEADGFLSSEPGNLLGIVTADCVPVLMVAPPKGVVVALHAGWRGTLKGITLRAIELLRLQWNVAPQDLYIALGPSIGGCCYEVGPEVGAEIAARWNIRSASAWRPVKGKGFLDLREVNAIQLVESGVSRAHINLTGPCTFCDSSFASYRREGKGAGRQLSVIGWRKI